MGRRTVTLTPGEDNPALSDVERLLAEERGKLDAFIAEIAAQDAQIAAQIAPLDPPPLIPPICPRWTHHPPERALTISDKALFLVRLPMRLAKLARTGRM